MSGERAGVGRVLVIDDEQMIVVSLVALLEHDFSVIGETSARAALERLRRGEIFDVILCDLRMPETTGVEFHQALVLSGSDHAAKVVFMSGAIPTHMTVYLSEVPNLCLEKPLYPKRLLEFLLDRIAGLGESQATPRPR